MRNSLINTRSIANIYSTDSKTTPCTLYDFDKRFVYTLFIYWANVMIRRLHDVYRISVFTVNGENKHEPNRRIHYVAHFTHHTIHTMAWILDTVVKKFQFHVAQIKCRMQHFTRRSTNSALLLPIWQTAKGIYFCLVVSFGKFIANYLQFGKNRPHNVHVGTLDSGTNIDVDI